MWNSFMQIYICHSALNVHWNYIIFKFKQKKNVSMVIFMDERLFD